MDCPHAPRCPGCPLIATPYPAQLANKRAAVKSAIAPYPALEGIELLATAPADVIEGYRTRVKLVVASDGAIGLYARGTHEVVDIPGCPVMPASIEHTVAAVREACRGSGETERRLADALVGVDLRQAVSQDGERVLLTLVLDGARAGSDPEQRAMGEMLRRMAPDVVGVAVSLRGRRDAQLLGGTPKVVAGASDVADEVAGIVHRATHGAFVQAHRGQAAKLHALIESALLRVLGGIAELRVLDLYGGSGAIGLALSRKGARVTLVESFAPAAKAARDAGLDVVVGDAAAIDPGASPDVVVVNPPRRGLAPRTRSRIAALAPRALVYVSCNPETLARDLTDLARLGFRARELSPIDMIPLSDHVEVLAVLRPSEPPLPELLFEHPDFCAVDKPAHEPTTPQGEHRGSLLERVRRRPGWVEAVPLHRLDIETSGACLFARDGQAAGRLQASLTGAAKTYVALVRGVTKERGVINRPLSDAGHARASRTRYRRRAVVGGQSLLGVQPDEGRKHQIRRHLAGIGHPLVGDHRYGHAPTNRHFEERHGLDRCFLHLERIELEVGGEKLSIESPLSADLAALTLKLRSEPER